MDLENVLMYLFVFALVAIVVGIIFMFILDDPVSGIEVVIDENGLEYDKFVISGMPCVYIQHSAGSSAHGGLSCDWAKYRGE